VTVDELKDYLEQLPHDAEVVLAGDAEGNLFSRLAGFDVAYTNEDGGRFEGLFWDEDLEEDGADPEEYEQVVVFWPV